MPSGVVDGACATSGAGGSGSVTTRVVLLSIGAASPRVRTILKQVLQRPEAEVARLLYQAPSELISGLNQRSATQISDLLTSIGLEVSVLPTSEPFVAGQGDCELALVLKDIQRLPEVAQHVAEVLDIGIAAAAQKVWASPAVLLGNISTATVEAVRRRFEALAVELDVSRPSASVFDFFMGRCESATRNHVYRILREAGAGKTLPEGAATPDTDTPLVAAGLDWNQATWIWERVSRMGAPVRILSRDFQRFDVCLDSAPDTADMIEFLTSDTGMPPAVARKVVRKLPVVLHQNVRFERARNCIESVAQLRGAASAHLLAFRTFRLIIEEAPRNAALDRILSFGANPTLKAYLPKRLPFEFPERLTPLRARWLQSELHRLGARVRLVLP